MPQQSGPPPAPGAGFPPPSFAPGAREVSSQGYLPRRARHGGYRAPGWGGNGGGGRGRGRGISSSSTSTSMPLRGGSGETFSFPSSYPLPPPPATPEERIDQLLDRISPTEETDTARAAVFAFLRSVVDRCFSECKVKKGKERTSMEKQQERRKLFRRFFPSPP